jgi:subtilisin family serine protease
VAGLALVPVTVPVAAGAEGAPQTGVGSATQIFDIADLAPISDLINDHQSSSPVAAVVVTGEGLDVVELDSDQPDVLADALEQIDGVIAAEPDGSWHTVGDGSGSYTSLQHNLAPIDAVPERSAGGTIVAVIDSGVFAHPDLPPMVPGWNTVDDNADTSPVTDHGTMVAGAITARSGNGIGIDATVNDIAIMPVRVCSAASCSFADVAEGIIWATDHGATVINLSLGGSYSAVTAAAITYAADHDVVVVAAGGNSGAGANPIVYPAALPEVLGVGAYGANDAVTSWASYGDWIDLAAPGEQIVTLGFSFPYVYGSGTSFAAPQVAAAAALLRSIDPGLDRAEIGAALIDSARDIHTSGWDPRTGNGSLDIGAAVALIDPTPVWAPDPPANEPGASGEARSVPASGFSRASTATVADATTIDELIAAHDYTSADADTLRLYRAFLGREPDLLGAKYWIGASRAGASADVIASAFAVSTEFTQTYGRDLGNADFLEIVYRNILGRDYDRAGYDYWLRTMAGGLSRPATVRWIAAAPEFKQRFPYC